MLLIINQ